MITLIRIAWRNIWRSPSRSGVLLASIAVGLWAGVMMSAVTNGFMAQRFDQLIGKELSHVQVHHPEFLTEREPAMVIPQGPELAAALAERPESRSVAVRILVEGMIQSPVTTSGVAIRGVAPQSEQATTGLRNSLIAGDYLDTDARNPILLGQRLAERLNLTLGNRAVLTFQDLNQELVSASFTVVGLYQTGSSAQELGQVYVRADTLNGYLAESPLVHEIAILLQDEAQSQAFAESVNADYEGLEAQTWFQLSPELRYLDDMGGVTTYIMMGVILVALAFGILNTMLMSLFERTREIGMLLAIGMNRRRVFAMILLESVMLTSTGAVAGMLLALANMAWLTPHGLDFGRWGGEALAEFGYDSVIVPVMDPSSFLGIAALVVVTAVLSAVYPAVRALRLKPAEAVRA